MAGKRRKGGRKTHAVKPDEELSKIPRSFVIKLGKVTQSVKSLTHDIRKVYRPWTAINLREQRKAALKDYISVGGLLNISHMVVTKQHKNSVYMSFLRTKGGEGPCCHFKVLSYSLISDVQRAQAKARMTDSDYINSPIIVTVGFDRKRDQSDPLEVKQAELASIKDKLILQAFPKISRHADDDEGSQQAQAFNGVRRVLLFVYEGKGIFQMRHYAILKTTNFKNIFNVKRKIKKLKNEGGSADKDVKGEVKQEILDEDEKLEFLKQNLGLIEIGPRVSLQYLRFADKLDSKIQLTQEELDALPSDDDELEEEEDDNEEEEEEEEVVVEREDGDTEATMEPATITEV